MDISQHNIKFSCRLGRALNYVDVGSGPALVIVNAYGVSTLLWDNVVEQMSQRFRVIIWNMRGFNSDEFDIDFSIEDHAQDLVEIVENAGIETVNLLAYCSGTKVALSAYKLLQDRVRSLSFVGGNFWPLDGYGPMKSPFSSNLKKVAGMVKKRPIIAPAIVAMMKSKILALPMIAQNINSISADYRDLVLKPFSSRGAVLNYADLVTGYYEQDTTPLLGMIDIPTLVIGAGCDAVVDPELSSAAAARIKHAEYIEIAEFNHFPMVENPKKLVSVVEGFIG
jgi:3-oxoadipate enol-lactonase